MSEHIVGVNPKEYNGKTYRSTLEARTAETLDQMGIPWEYETRKLTLQEGFYCQYQKDKVRAVEYTPDFFIGPIMVEMKGFETPDWKIKKKMFFKYLKENEPEAIWYMAKNIKQLIEALDNHWAYLGIAVQVTPKPSRKADSIPVLYDSIQQALDLLNLKGKSIGPIIKSLTNKTQYVYGYNWKLIKLNL